MEKKRVPLSSPLPTFVLRSFSSGVTCVKYDFTDSFRLYTAEQQGSIHLYNLRTRLPILSLPNAHTSTILGLSQLTETNKLITFSKDGFVKIWNENGQCQWEYQTNHCSFSNCDIISPNLIVVPIGNENSTIAALDYQSSNPIIKQFTPLSTDSTNGMVMKLRVFDNRWLFVAYENGSIKVFDISTTKQLDTYQITSDHEPITAMDVICETCLCGTTKSDLISLDFTSLKLQPTSTFRQIEMPNAGTSFIRCRPDDGKLIAVAGWDSRIRLFRRETGKQLAMFDLHRQQVNSIDFDYHTRQMACGSEDRTVSIWDVYNKNNKRENNS
jgi:WD40 repeat protein